MWICKHCQKEYELTASQKANHSRWCDKNPKVAQYVEKHKDVTVSRDGVAFVAKTGGKESRSVYLHDALAELLQKTRRL